MFLNGKNETILINNFIKDNIGLTVSFFANAFFIILFYYLYTDGNVPCIYPISISLFIYGVYMLSRIYRYIKFNRDIKNSIDNPNYNIATATCEEKEIKAVINSIHRKYTAKLELAHQENMDMNKFFSQWVHNTKTPVSVIDLIIQKLKNKQEFDDKLINEIEEENSIILNNLEQVLNMLRVEDFSKDYIPGVVDLNASVKNVVNEKKRQFIYNKVFPKICYEAENIPILSDKKWNEFMIAQILSNTIKYSSCKENKNIYLNIVKKDMKTILYIKDEGMGIPASDISRIFEPFFTGENGRKVKNSTGIGLYICKVICEKLGHEIEIKSEEGKGTEVIITYLSKS
ncbi:sensor histidine kinase [Clostridiaceae bacterium UIB06]|nr:sensor histidine kinase [Clostridiaceae bacterium UIB06]